MRGPFSCALRVIFTTLSAARREETHLAAGRYLREAQWPEDAVTIPSLSP